MDRIAHEMGWAAMTFTFRGCGDSDGDFSLKGWVEDLKAAIKDLEGLVRPDGLWLAGTSTGGSLSARVAADDPRIRGAAPLPARAALGDWAARPRRFLAPA